jgi:surfeit locus 1 family protein
VPIVRVRVGRRLFAPSWRMTVLTVLLTALFVRLGEWQWHKGILRDAEWKAFARGADRAVPLAGERLDKLPRFQRVEVSGRLDGMHQFLLDNRIHAGEAGYEVLTPLMLADGHVLLVDRGWVPFTGYRARLPDVHLEAADVVRLTGRIDSLPSPGLAQGRAAPPPGTQWPKVTAYPSMRELSVALGQQLPERILLLDAQAPYGYVREWQPPGMAPARHLSYAIQWWGFAFALIVIWAVLSSPVAPGNKPEPRA